MTASPREAAEPAALEEAARWCLRLSTSELSRGEGAALQAWLAAAPIHQDLLDDAIRAWGAVDEQAAHPALLELRSAALIDLRHARGALRARRSIVTRAAWGLAASVAIGIAVMFGVDRYGGQVYRTADAERRVVTLEDGSVISLDARSVLKVQYADDARRLHVTSGRAKFSVAHDPLRPFSVGTGNVVAVATGTQFSVERLTADVRVVLYEGRVAIYKASETSGGRLVPFKTDQSPDGIVLSRGQALIATPSGDAPRIVSDDASKSLAWEGGQLVFSDEPLATALERVNRYSAQKVRVGDAIAADVRVSGVFSAGDTRAFVDGVTALFPVREKSVNGEVTLVSDMQR